MKTKPTKRKYDDSRLIMKCINAIEKTFGSLKIDVKVAQVNIEKHHYNFSLKLGDGIEISDIRKYLKDLSQVLEIPSSTIQLKDRNTGTGLTGLVIPKPPDEYFEEQIEAERRLYTGKGLRTGLAFIFFLFGRVNYRIAHRIISGRRAGNIS